jgi:hypothetical protein
LLIGIKGKTSNLYASILTAKEWAKVKINHSGKASPK